MRKKRHSAEEIVNKLREADVELSRGSRSRRPAAKSGSRSRPTAGGAAAGQHFVVPCQTQTNQIPFGL